MLDTTLVELQIGNRIARVNDRPVTLDVPAMVVGGRTLVPLRFISESLGAGVQWQAASRTVLIFSGSQAGPPPVSPPLQQTSTIRGVITSVVLAQSAQDQPRITVESGNIATTVRITTETAITRVEASSGTGGSVGVAALRPGDDAEISLAGNVGRQTVTAGPRGGFVARVPITVVSPNSLYLITVTATHTQLGQEQRQITVTVAAD